MESKICKCKEWIVRGGKGYTGEIFSYCPWCGENLKILCNHCGGKGIDNFGSEEMPDLDDCLLCDGRGFIQK